MKSKQYYYLSTLKKDKILEIVSGAKIELLSSSGGIYGKAKGDKIVLMYTYYLPHSHSDAYLPHGLLTPVFFGHVREELEGSIIIGSFQVPKSTRVFMIISRIIIILFFIFIFPQTIDSTDSFFLSIPFLLIQVLGCVITCAITFALEYLGNLLGKEIQSETNKFLKNKLHAHSAMKSNIQQ